MSDKPVVHIGENSPEKIAYVLLKDVMQAEDMSLLESSGDRRPKKRADRKYLLDTFVECINAVKGYGRD